MMALTSSDPIRDERRSPEVPKARSPQPLFEIRGLSVDYGSGPGSVHAVDDVDLVIHRGEALGLAGESGSGKSTLAFAITQLLRPPAQVTKGQVLYHESGDAGTVDVLTLSKSQLRKYRWEEVAVVFQSAMNALNPVIDVRTQLTDALRAHRPKMTRQQQYARAAELLELVGVSGDRLRSFPHQLSGGMRQRVMIAMALALNPDLIVMDEPTTALDVVTQSQILEKIEDLRKEFGFAYLFITHDLSLLLDIADSIAIMYAGRIVEIASAKRLYLDPAHPYSRGLLRSFPPLTGARRELTGIPGFPPDLRNLPPGCSFAPRCEHAMDICRRERPRETALPEPDGSRHLVVCWLYPEGEARSSNATPEPSDV